ncbi:ribonuclease III [Gracilinema caldarium]|uniref:Ribonuclease 3 n=1 Tax=Gracilinema caldarium (strain ATCC 51460 / DSM 7334 / H1) TaxID=744872 RepID=F8F3H4_GRAC1|nr:ribonuclease III [Gracilinema caldarium]AEJ19550.1 Ribonuclease 3 [Gracilinema caldarium DSM 7334]
MKDRSIQAVPAGSNTVNSARKQVLIDFQKTAAIRFRSLELLNLSFIHRSASNEFPQKINNERLEFLGDAILGACTATILYEKLSAQPEGELAKIKSVVVSEDTLAGIARELQIDVLLILGKGEELSGGRTKKAILADALEALIGAYYLDSGYKAVFEFISKYLEVEIERVVTNQHHRDYKTLLQEKCQQLYKNYPTYTLLKRTGPDHERMFWVEVHVNGVAYGPGIGKNKKEAEQEAAKLAYKAITDIM